MYSSITTTVGIKDGVILDRCRAKITAANASLIDSKAGLLYKINRKDEAIQLEADVAKLDPADKDIS